MCLFSLGWDVVIICMNARQRGRGGVGGVEKAVYALLIILDIPLLNNLVDVYDVSGLHLPVYYPFLSTSLQQSFL